MSEQQEKRMVSDTGYEVTQSMRIGGKEILLAENMRAEDEHFYMVATYREQGFLAEYSNAVTSDDYIEAVQEFAGRIASEAEAVRTEQSKITVPPTPIITKDQCHPHNYGQDLVDKIVAIKADVLSPEYRRGDFQLVWVTGGNGARSGARGSAVFCRHLNSGEHTRFERQDVLGVVHSEYLPHWSKVKREEFRNEQKTPPPSKEYAGRYEITERIEVGQKVFALGHNKDAAQSYGTWQGRKDAKDSFDIGHYFSSYEAAKGDLQDRAAKEQQRIERPKRKEQER
jgi:hypothetical protein